MRDGDPCQVYVESILEACNLLLAWHWIDTPVEADIGIH